MRIFLVRHGEAEGNRGGIILGQADVPLTDLGREQIQRLGNALAGRPISAIYSSPLRRANDTAQAIAATTRAPVHLLADLREMNCGLAQGLTWPDVERQWPDFARRYTAGDDGITIRYPDGESSRDLYERVGRALDLIVGRHASVPTPVHAESDDGDAIAIVAHGGSLAWALQHLLKKPLTTWPRFGLGNCSISEVLVHTLAAPAEVIRLNDVSHL